MRILLSNDDGYLAPGLVQLATSLADQGDITVVAPERRGGQWIWCRRRDQRVPLRICPAPPPAGASSNDQ